MPQGLSKHEEKILLKIKKRAHHLDKGFKLCGIRFGWTFIIGLVPFAGDIADALLSHNLIVKKAQQIEGYVCHTNIQHSRRIDPSDGDEQLHVNSDGLHPSSWRSRDCYLQDKLAQRKTTRGLYVLRAHRSLDEARWVSCGRGEYRHSHLEWLRSSPFARGSTYSHSECTSAP